MHQSNRFQNKSNYTSNSRNNKWCNVCRSYSHTNAECRKQQGEFMVNDNRGAKRNSHHRDVSNHIQVHNDNETDHDFIFYTDENLEDENNGNVKKKEMDDTLLVDCGATSHIVNDITKFISFDEDFNSSKHSIELADGKISNNLAEKRGTVQVFIKNENDVLCPVLLKKTLYIPTFPQEIFSVKAACNNIDPDKKNTGKPKVVLDGNGGTLNSRQGIKFPITTKGNLYYLKLYCENHDEIKKFETSETVRSHSLSKWHVILGHPNKRDILYKEEKVSNMRVTSKTDKIKCDACILGKQVVTVSREADERSKIPFNLIHSDIAGPILPMSKNGFKYVINFIDDFSGTIFIYFLKNKSDAPKALLKFLADIAPYIKDKSQLARFRSDNGTEYTSKEFEDILIEHQIRHEFSAPYCPHQNGSAERNWRTLFEVARCMLTQANLPKYLWIYALMTAAHLRNRMYSQRIQDTPYHLLTEKQPINKLHTFGSICFAFENKNKQKLGPRSKRGIFLGYDKYSPAYLV